MGHWNYRVIRHHYPEAVPEEQTLYEIHEVYYNEEPESPFLGKHLRAYGPAKLYGVSEKELKDTWAMILEAFKAPILDEKEFES